jgi:hypothetical protein
MLVQQLMRQWSLYWLLTHIIVRCTLWWGWEILSKVSISNLAGHFPSQNAFKVNQVRKVMADYSECSVDYNTLCRLLRNFNSRRDSVDCRCSVVKAYRTLVALWCLSLMSWDISSIKLNIAPTFQPPKTEGSVTWTLASIKSTSLTSVGL